MIRATSIIRSLCLAACAGLLALSGSTHAQSSENLKGAWVCQEPGSQAQMTAIFTGKYVVRSTYDQAGKQFLETLGGTYSYDNGVLTVHLEFSTDHPEAVGRDEEVMLQLKGDEMVVEGEHGALQTWRRLDKGDGALAGNWRIVQREQDGQMHDIKPGARKTVKVLSGTRFQWAAINTATGEFFGTGGGHYTFKDGVYTENIDFFSRDSSRVGMSLQFEGRVEGNRWHHKGKSSKGAPIYEIWEKTD